MSGVAAPAGPMVVGLDLAWGTRSPTGVALVQADDDPRSGGRLLGHSSLVTDADLDAAIGPLITGPCLLAIDAPLIVRNATGRRPCEAALSRAFASQHAGAYPSNTGLAPFTEGGRAAAFARRHALDVDAAAPVAGGQRRAIEVYPHSATVALFDLPKVLAYKARPGRSLNGRKEALLTLVTLLAGLAEPPDLPALTAPDGTFDAVGRRVQEAPTAAALRRLEDPIDAIMCAYIGLLFLAGRACVISDGADGSTGAIVTPVRERHLQILGEYACGQPAIR